MPEVLFTVRWPDRHEERCYSPSTVVREHLAAGERYPLDEFLARAGRALEEASERVRARYGHPCGNAAAQLESLRRTAAGQPDGDVHVLDMTPPHGAPSP